MTYQHCTLSDSDLVAHADGYLSGARRERVAAHIATCANCQARLGAFAEVDRLLQSRSPVVDNPADRAALMARLEREGYGRRAWNVSRHSWQPSRALLAAPAVLLMLALIFQTTLVSEAGYRFGRIVRFAPVEVQQRLSPAAEPLLNVRPSDTDANLTFRVVAPASLPHGLELAERSIPADGRAEVLYRAPDLTILVFQAPVEPDAVIMDAENTAIVTVGDTEILWLKDPRPDAVSAIYWERSGIFFSLRVLESPVGPFGGLDITKAVEIVAAVMVAQDGLVD